MTVVNLIEKLQNLPLDAEVCFRDSRTMQSTSLKSVQYDQFFQKVLLYTD